MRHPLLFSIDLEEFYAVDRDLGSRSAPLKELVSAYLQLLASARARCTFFAVGQLARKTPDLIETIAKAGHELACHGHTHTPLDQLDAQRFASDLRANRAALEAAGATPPVGFRAPIFSLTMRTQWAYRVLSDEGFAYSSSVLPADNPLYGWKEFGKAPRTIDGIRELPITVGPFLGKEIPLFGGTYFRVLPYALIRRRLRATLAARPALAYFHPYDIDARQPWTMHSGVHGSPFLNTLLFLRRGSLPRRLARLLHETRPTLTYAEFVQSTPASE